MEEAEMYNMMRKWLSYGFVLATLLLAPLSCRKVTQPVGDGCVTIHFSTAELEVTKTEIPGDAQAGDGGGFSDYYMSFNAPYAGTLKIWASSTDGTSQKICILEGGVVTTENSGTGTSKPADGDALTVGVVGSGPVTIYPCDGVSRIYKLEFTYENELGDDFDLTWDFGSVDFQNLLSNPLAVTVLPPATSIPNKDADTPWMITLENLTIWSKTASRWVSGAGGYFQWGGYFNSDESTVPVDLVILIADNQVGSPTRGNIVATYPSSGRDGVIVGEIKSQSAVDALVSFSITGKGEDWNYTVYAFGNTAGLWSMTTDGSNTISNLTGLTTAADVEALKFKAQTRYNAEWEPADASDDTNSDGVSDTYAALTNTEKYDDGVLLGAGGRLPVSAKASLTVSAGGNGDAYLELLRCVAKVTAKIINNTGYPLHLYDYKHTVHRINPDQGWVIPHDDDVTGTAANLLANPCAKYNNDSMYVPVSSEGSREYNWYVFPSTGPYDLCLQFTLDKDNPSKKKTYSYTHLPITDWRAQNIPALARNQHLTVTTRISKGLTVSFNFEVVTWAPEDTHTASVVFD